jgi:hypothetical protein
LDDQLAQFRGHGRELRTTELLQVIGGVDGFENRHSKTSLHSEKRYQEGTKKI